MNLFKHNLLAAVMLASSTAPFAVLADEAPATPAPEAQEATAAPDAADRIKLMQDMRTRMHEIMQTQDVDKRNELMEAQKKDMDALMEMGPPAGMVMMMGQGMGPGPMAMGYARKDNCRMGQGPGMGMMAPGMGMMGSVGNKPCMMDRGGNCHAHGGAIDQRMDALEKRMDMMQMMMQYMMRN
jgi:hypothetical protein